MVEYAVETSTDVSPTPEDIIAVLLKRERRMEQTEGIDSDINDRKEYEDRE